MLKSSALQECYQIRQMARMDGNTVKKENFKLFQIEERIFHLLYRNMWGFVPLWNMDTICSVKICVHPSLCLPEVSGISQHKSDEEYPNLLVNSLLPISKFRHRHSCWNHAPFCSDIWNLMLWGAHWGCNKHRMLCVGTKCWRIKLGLIPIASGTDVLAGPCLWCPGEVRNASLASGCFPRRHSGTPCFPWLCLPPETWAQGSYSHYDWLCCLMAAYFHCSRIVLF